MRQKTIALSWIDDEKAYDYNPSKFHIRLSENVQDIPQYHEINHGSQEKKMKLN